MKTFLFKGVRSDGTIVEGEYQANVLQDVFRRMELHGMYPLKATEVVHGEMPAPEMVATANAEMQMTA
jgi:hypothetical protein